MTSPNYRKWFIFAVVGNALLAAALASLWWRSRPVPNSTSTPQPQPATVAADKDPPAQPESAPLTPVQLTPQRMQMIGVTSSQAEMKQVHDEIRVTGTVDVDEEKLAYVQLRFPGWIQKVYANATYQYLRKGQPLFTIYSPEVSSTEQEYVLAQENRNALAKSSSAAATNEANWLLEATADRLRRWQVPAAEITRLNDTGKVEHDITVVSPVSGYITERAALPNMYVQPETKLYTVADLSTVWVFAQVFQSDLGKIKHGDPATVTVDAYPGRTFRGRVDFVYPQVDMNTRTARVRLVFPNTDLKLTPGMYVNVMLGTPMGRQLVVPADAVFHSGMRKLVFVDHGGGVLEPTEVQLGSRVGDDFIVRKGVQPGTTVVTSANFLLDSESQLQAAAGAYMPPPPGAGGASGAPVTTAPAAAQANIDLTTEPSPPHKGSNIFRVKLTSTDGKPLAGAQVNVTFFMPAMPAMGMAAMRTSVDLTDKGGGVYEGKGTLDSGGTWQVTLTARQNGQTIASKQFTVNAEGGM
jgi:Cu(I)/Ag(I) efflux system membrane fusion protein/cobalt-zinc-cadmium efflux system membrane fusion protein